MPTDTNLLETIKTEIYSDLGLSDCPSQITVDQTAKILDVAPNTLSIWRCLGRHNLPFVKTGKSIKYRVADVAEFIARHRYSHTDQVAAA